MSVLEIGVDSALRFAPERFWTEEKPCRGSGFLGCFCPVLGGVWGGSFTWRSVSSGFVFGVVCSGRPQDVPAVCLALCLRHWWPRGWASGPCSWSAGVCVCVSGCTQPPHLCVSLTATHSAWWALSTSTVQMQNY